MNDPMLEVRPLSSWFWGNLRLLTRSGMHRLRIDEEAAHKLRNSFERGEPADAVHEGSFLALETDGLDAMEWIADSRQPGKETSQDRELRRLGGALFEGGWLQALREVAPHDASYSAACLIAWKAAALLLLKEQKDLSESSREKVLRILAEMWEGVPDPGQATPEQTIQRRAHTPDSPAEPSAEEAADPSPQAEHEPHAAQTGSGTTTDKQQVGEELADEADGEDGPQEAHGPVGSGDAP